MRRPQRLVHIFFFNLSSNLMVKRCTLQASEKELFVFLIDWSWSIYPSAVIPANSKRVRKKKRVESKEPS